MTTPGPLTEFREGPVPVWDDSDGYLQRMQEEFPISVEHRIMLRRLGSDFVFAKPLGQGAWLALIRFGGVIEKRFGFDREIVCLYSPFEDLQIRNTNQLDLHIKSLPNDRRNAYTDVAFVWTPDARLETKLKSWSTAARVLVRLVDGDPEEAPRAQLNELAKNLYAQDPYQIRVAVTGTQFFGRDRTIDALRAELVSGRIPGLFGLRKTGKTSLLKQLVEIFDEVGADGQPVCAIYQDLEYLRDIDANPIQQLLPDLSAAISARLSAIEWPPLNVSTLHADRLSNFYSEISNLLRSLGERRLLILFDEIERLCPPAQLAQAGSISRGEIPRFFSILRKLVQEHPNFGFALSGLASGSLQQSTLYGQSNPLYSLGRPFFVGPFESDEASELLVKLGSRAGLDWRPEACALAFRESGGHPLLLRELASAVLEREKNARTRVAEVAPGNVSRVTQAWRRNVAVQLREVAEHVKRYYPTDWELLTLAMDANGGDLAEWLVEYPEEAARMIGLGMLTVHENGSIAPSRLLEISWELAVAERRPAEKLTWSDVARMSLDRLLGLDESEVLEFKSSAITPTQKAVPSDVLLDEIVREILGFLNSRGGVLLVGVSDDGSVLGLMKDVASAGSWDKLQVRIESKIRSSVGDILLDSIECSRQSVGILDILRIVVPPSNTPIWSASKVRGNDTDVLFVRQGATVQPMKGQAIYEWTQQHFK